MVQGVDAPLRRCAAQLHVQGRYRFEVVGEVVGGHRHVGQNLRPVAPECLREDLERPLVEVRIVYDRRESIRDAQAYGASRLSRDSFGYMLHALEQALAAVPAEAAQ